VLDENDVARPFIEECLIEDPNAVTTLPDIQQAAKNWLAKGGLILACDVQLDRVMEGVRARWNHGRKRIEGHQVRGLIGVRLREAS
jgi:hypothetical protein